MLRKILIYQQQFAKLNDNFFQNKELLVSKDEYLD